MQERTIAAGRQNFRPFRRKYLSNSRSMGLLLCPPVYHTVVTKLRREASQREQGLFLFSFPFLSSGGRGFWLRLKRR